MSSRRVFAIFVFACFLISVWSLADARGLRQWRHLRHSCCDDNCGRPATDDVAELVTQGDALREKDDWKGAIAAYTKAIERDPQCAKAYCGRGRVHVENDDYDRAIADLTEAIRLDPAAALAYEQRGRALGRKGQLGEAIADLHKAVGRDPKNAEFLAVRGALYGTKGDLDKAIADATEAIRLAPKSGYAFEVRGAAIQADPRCVEAYTCRARIHEKMGHGDKAKAEARRLGSLKR